MSIAYSRDYAIAIRKSYIENDNKSVMSSIVTNNFLNNFEHQSKKADCNFV